MTSKFFFLWTLVLFSLDGVSAYVEELDLPEYHDNTRKPGGHWGSFVCHDFLKIWRGDPAKAKEAEKLCGRWSAYDHEGHGVGALETVPLKAMVDSCAEDEIKGSCQSHLNLHIEMDGGIIGNDQGLWSDSWFFFYRLIPSAVGLKLIFCRILQGGRHFRSLHKKRTSKAV